MEHSFKEHMPSSVNLILVMVVEHNSKTFEVVVEVNKSSRTLVLQELTSKNIEVEVVVEDNKLPLVLLVVQVLTSKVQVALRNNSF